MSDDAIPRGPLPASNADPGDAFGFVNLAGVLDEFDISDCAHQIREWYKAYTGGQWSAEDGREPARSLEFQNS